MRFYHLRNFQVLVLHIVVINQTVVFYYDRFRYFRRLIKTILTCDIYILIADKELLYTDASGNLILNTINLPNSSKILLPEKEGVYYKLIV